MSRSHSLTLYQERNPAPISADHAPRQIIKTENAGQSREHRVHARPEVGGNELFRVSRTNRHEALQVGDSEQRGPRPAFRCCWAPAMPRDLPLGRSLGFCRVLAVARQLHWDCIQEKPSTQSNPIRNPW